MFTKPIFIISISLMLAVANSFAQEQVINRNSSGQITETYTVVEGKRHGSYVSYHANGKKSSEGGYVKDDPFGRWVEYHDNGRVFRETQYANGSLTGIWTEYYNTGQIKEHGTAAGGRWGQPTRTGIWVEYYANGKKGSEGEYVKNDVSGRWVQYHENGSILREMNYTNGALTGTWTEYYATGQIKQQGTADGGRWGQPNRTGLWVSYDRSGKVTDATIYDKNREVGKANYSTNPDNGVTTIAASNPDGSRTVVDVDKNGLVQKQPDDVKPKTDTLTDAGDLVAMSIDPATGRTTTIRKNPDGSTTTYTGIRKKDADGTERIDELDPEGNRIETAVSPDGRVTVTKSTALGGDITTTTHPNGTVVTVERDAAGNTKASALAEDGSIVTQHRNSKGQIIETTRDRPDGWTEYVDPQGNRRSVLRDPDGQTTSVNTDRFGNTTTVVTDAKGNVVDSQANIIGPREPGRTYFEQVLKGTDWDRLPQSLKTKYAYSERSMEEFEAKKASDAATAVRMKAEDARIAAERAGRNAESIKKLEAIRLEQEQADRIAAQRKARVERREKIEESYETAKKLQDQYDAAIARGDKREAQRIMGLQDEHHEKSMAILRHTPEELKAMDRYSDVRSKLANDIRVRAQARAAKKIAADEASQDTKDGVTSYTQHLSSGSQMQQATKAATRTADRQLTLAKATQEEIELSLRDPSLTPEQRTVLEQMQQLARVQEDGAAQHLAANARLTAAGYGIDAALALSGGKLIQGGGQLIKGTANAVAKAAGRRTLNQAGAAGTASSAGRIGGTTIIDGSWSGKSTIIDNPSVSGGGGTTTIVTGRPTGAGAAVIAPASNTAGLTGKGIHSVMRSADEWEAVPREELARLFRPGRALSRSEVITKTDLFGDYVIAQSRYKRAIESHAPAAVLTELEATYVRMHRLVKQFE